ncbi:MAG TPA: TadE/TadG family type IV pilus assembly protein [Candidatus Sulfotelmatobacter sp.]|jgi:Flp pilus assembly protein TadG|nr:TadE/TadG family type IV pilus assembly protein [Candidatus Sulfotelmatobacter sp.]
MSGESYSGLLKMTNIARNTLRRLAGETRGSEIAEAAAVLPIMFMILIGIFWFGQAFSIYGTITRAAQDGARAAVAPYCVTCTSPNTPPQNAFNAVTSALSAAHLNSSQIIPPSNWTAPPPAPVDCTREPLALAAYTDTGNVRVYTHVKLSQTSGTGPAVCGVSVSFAYPYQFWLPFTTLNKQSIQFQAVARVRLEAQ